MAVGDGWLPPRLSHYGVPDQRLTQESPKVQIESALVKKYFVGRIVDVYWRGKDFGLGVLERLNDDTSLRKPELALQVKIRAYPEHGQWILATATEDLPSVEVWNCYQAIARHLLDT